jgi:hypothetical protein
LFIAACDVPWDNLQDRIKQITDIYNIAIDGAKGNKKLVRKLLAQRRGEVNVWEDLGNLMERSIKIGLIMWRGPGDRNCGALPGVELCKSNSA